jgi:hypothetical protein
MGSHHRSHISETSITIYMWTATAKDVSCVRMGHQVEWKGSAPNLDIIVFGLGTKCNGTVHPNRTFAEDAELRH